MAKPKKLSFLFTLQPVGFDECGVDRLSLAVPSSCSFGNLCITTHCLDFAICNEDHGILQDFPWFAEHLGINQCVIARRLWTVARKADLGTAFRHQCKYADRGSQCRSERS